MVEFDRKAIDTAELVKDTDLEPSRLSREEIEEYKPRVLNREWLVSETDLDWISIGCYILGTGGGGSPYGHMLRLREVRITLA